MVKDPIIEELHAIREQHAAEYNYDIGAIIAALQREELLSGRQFVHLEESQPQLANQ
jgi:hypothetical protein